MVSDVDADRGRARLTGPQRPGPAALQPISLLQPHPSRAAGRAMIVKPPEPQGGGRSFHDRREPARARMLEPPPTAVRPLHAMIVRWLSS